MSDIRLVNVVPIVNGWNDAAKEKLEEAKALMASENHLDYNAGVVKESVANLVSGFADDLMKAPAVDPGSRRPESEWELNPHRFSCEHFRCKKCHHIDCAADKYCGECGSKMKNAGVKPEDLPIPKENNDG